MDEDELVELELREKDWTLRLERVEGGLHLRVWDEEGVLDDRVLQGCGFTASLHEVLERHRGQKTQRAKVLAKWSSGAACEVRPRPGSSLALHRKVLLGQHGMQTSLSMGEDVFLGWMVGLIVAGTLLLSGLCMWDGTDTFTVWFPLRFMALSLVFLGAMLAFVSRAEAALLAED